MADNDAGSNNFKGTVTLSELLEIIKEKYRNGRVRVYLNSIARAEEIVIILAKKRRPMRASEIMSEVYWAYNFKEIKPKSRTRVCHRLLKELEKFGIIKKYEEANNKIYYALLYKVIPQAVIKEPLIAINKHPSVKEILKLNNSLILWRGTNILIQDPEIVTTLMSILHRIQAHMTALRQYAPDEKSLVLLAELGQCINKLVCIYEEYYTKGKLSFEEHNAFEELQRKIQALINVPFKTI